MGMLLTTPMIVIGAAVMVFAYRRKVPSGNVIGPEAGGADPVSARAGRGNTTGRDAGAKV